MRILRPWVRLSADPVRCAEGCVHRTWHKGFEGTKNLGIWGKPGMGPMPVFIHSLIQSTGKSLLHVGPQGFSCMDPAGGGPISPRLAGM